jgi:hypothetical protein
MARILEISIIATVTLVFIIDIIKLHCCVIIAYYLKKSLFND